jgi:hypothetical protein
MPPSVPPAAPLSLFYSYSKKDKAHRERLETHLSLLKDQGVISDWHDRLIEAGTEWDEAIRQHLEEDGIILFLVSPDFFATRYIRDNEIARAMERHEAGTARVIPVILRPFDAWHTAPFGKLQALPEKGKAVTKWRNRDEAFADVARGIREAAASLGAGAPNPPTRPQPAPVVTSLPTTQARAVDQATLVRELGELDHADWASLVAMIPGAAKHVSRHGTVPEQAAELIRWAGSRTGCGLDVIERTLASFR